MKKSFCKMLLVMLIVIITANTALPIASALAYSDSDIWLVDVNTKKTVSTLYLYGRADYICLKLKEDEGHCEKFYFALYSDPKYENKIFEYCTYGADDSQYITLPIVFDNLESKTYYAVTYVKKSFASNGGTLKFDKSTFRSYKVVIKKEGTNIKDMNTVMYGYSNTEKGPAVYWYSVPDATGYYLYRKNPKTGKYEKIKTVKNDGKKITGCVDKSLKDVNVTRYYKVVAYKGSAKTPLSQKSLQVKTLKTPKVKAKILPYNEVEISWTKSAKGAVYALYRRTAQSDWKLISSGIEERVYIDKTNKGNKTYFYTVVASTDDRHSGNVSGAKVVFSAAPSLKKCTYTKNGGIVVNWSAVAGVDGYRIYRKVTGESKWSTLADVNNAKATSYVDKNVNTADVYSYRVKAIREGKVGSYERRAVKGSIVEEPTLISVVQAQDNFVRINWEKVPGNCAYRVYVKDGSQWKHLGKTEEAYFDYKFPFKVTEQSFTVKAVREGFYSTFDENGVAVTTYPKLVFSDFCATKDGLTICWKKPNGAGNTLIYRKVADGEYELLGETSRKKFTDNTAQAGIEYTYKIIYKHNGELIDVSATEKSIEITNESVDIVNRIYEPIASGKDYYYSLKIGSFKKGAQYTLFEKDENGDWKASAYKVNSKGFVNVLCLDESKEYAFSKLTTDGKISIISENSFVIDYAVLPQDFIIEKKINKLNTMTSFVVTWNKDSQECDEIYVTKCGSVVAVVPVSDGVFACENLDANAFYDYDFYAKKGMFVSSVFQSVEHNNMKAPDFKVKLVDGVKISWVDDVSKASVYRVYRKSPGDSKWNKIADVRDKKYYINKRKINDVGTYIYTVRAQDSFGNWSPFNKEGLSIKYVKKPDEITFTRVKEGFSVTWSKVKGCDGYILQYFDSKTEQWITLKTLMGDESVSYTDKSVPSGEERKYAVCSFSGDVSSVTKESKSSKLYLSQPEIKSLKKEKQGVKVEFDTVNGATSYYLYRKTGSSSKWKRIDIIYDSGYVDETAKNGKKYTYSVQARCGRDYSTYNTKGKSINF